MPSDATIKKDFGPRHDCDLCRGRGFLTVAKLSVRAAGGHWQEFTMFRSAMIDGFNDQGWPDWIVEWKLAYVPLSGRCVCFGSRDLIDKSHGHPNGSVALMDIRILRTKMTSMYGPEQGDGPQAGTPAGQAVDRPATEVATDA